MAGKIGIRREDMYAWERRTPLTPADARELQRDTGLEIVVQSSPKRIHSDDEYRGLGLTVAENLADCPLVVGLKEIPVDVFEPNKTYVFFSHTIKGQPANMPMLRRALDLGCTIIDYERIVDEHERRLIFFGNYAGLAGMIDTLWSLGRRLAREGIRSPFERIRQASDYADLGEAKAAIRSVGDEIRTRGLPAAISPLVIGIAGYGNVSKGAQEILDLLPLMEIHASDLLGDSKTAIGPNHAVGKVIFREEDMALRLDGGPFDLAEYYEHPERYRAAFSRYFPHLHVLVNCIYWEPKYPRLVSRGDVRDLFSGEDPRLRVIGDISCDVEGAIEVTLKATEPDDPLYVYLPSEDRIVSGVEGHGPVMMAVDILPSELPREASAFFSGRLKGLIPAIAAADYALSLEECGLPPELMRAVIAYRGELTPDYRYLEEYLSTAEAP